MRFAVWINGAGILVDPPAITTQYLREQGIRTNLINKVILTHCHRYCNLFLSLFSRLLSLSPISLCLSLALHLRFVSISLLAVFLSLSPSHSLSRIPFSHSDHDSGLLKKILDGERITVYTTKTVNESYKRKMNAVTGLNIAEFYVRLRRRGREGGESVCVWFLVC